MTSTANAITMTANRAIPTYVTQEGMFTFMVTGCGLFATDTVTVETVIADVVCICCAGVSVGDKG